MLTCSGCERDLPEVEFYVSNLTRCKACLREYKRVRRARLAAQELLKRPADWKRKTADMAAYRRAWLASRPGYFTEKKREWLKRNPERARARWAYRKALKSGRLVRGPCEVCGCLEVDGHHEDYAKPLEVRWLCREHHLEAHGKRAHGGA